MPPALTLLLAVAAAYLLGSIPFAVVSSRLFGLADPRTYGSKNPGATNVLRSGNKGAAAVTLLGDAAKGWLAVFLAQQSGLPASGVALVALAVFFGHLFPVFLKFKGGKGVATYLGTLLALWIPAGLFACATWLVVAFVSRFSSLSALVAAAAAPFVLFAMGKPEFAVAAAAMTLLVFFRHQANIVRLLKGEEPRIGAKKAA